MSLQQWNTAGSQVAGSYSSGGTGTVVTFSNSNLTVTYTTLGNSSPFFVYGFATSGVTSGKFYWEIALTQTGGNVVGCGIGNTSSSTSVDLSWFLGQKPDSLGYQSSGQVQVNNVVITTLASYTSPARICLALDATAKLLWVRPGISANWNNAVITSQNPATGTGGLAIASAIYAHPMVPAYNLDAAGATAVASFSAGSWLGTAPSGFGSFNSVCNNRLMLLGVGCGIWAAKKIEENPILTRRRLLLPPRIGHNGGPPLDE